MSLDKTVCLRMPIFMKHRVSLCVYCYAALCVFCIYFIKHCVSLCIYCYAVICILCIYCYETPCVSVVMQHYVYFVSIL